MRVKIRIKGSTADFALLVVPETFEGMLQRCCDALQLKSKEIQLFVCNSRVLSLDVLENLDEVEVCPVNHTKILNKDRAKDTGDGAPAIRRKSKRKASPTKSSTPSRPTKLTKVEESELKREAVSVLTNKRTSAVSISGKDEEQDEVSEDSQDSQNFRDSGVVRKRSSRINTRKPSRYVSGSSYKRSDDDSDDDEKEIEDEEHTDAIPIPHFDRGEMEKIAETRDAKGLMKKMEEYGWCRFSRKNYKGCQEYFSELLKHQRVGTSMALNQGQRRFTGTSIADRYDLIRFLKQLGVVKPMKHRLARLQHPVGFFVPSLLTSSLFDPLLKRGPPSSLYKTGDVNEKPKNTEQTTHVPKQSEVVQSSQSSQQRSSTIIKLFPRPNPSNTHQIALNYTNLDPSYQMFEELPI